MEVLLPLVCCVVEYRQCGGVTTTHVLCGGVQVVWRCYYHSCVVWWSIGSVEVLLPLVCCVVEYRQCGGVTTTRVLCGGV